MNRIRLGFYFLLGILVSALALETVLRFLPVTRGLFRTVEADRWPLNAFTPHTRYTYSMTWDFQNSQTGYTNNYGHLAPFDFVKNSRPVLVLGDSFIEAQMLRYPDTLQGQLERRIGANVPVYGMGFSGNSIAEYLAIARMAKDEFQPRAAVILMIDGDISESIGASPNHYFFEFKDGQPKLQYQAFRGMSVARRIREPLGDSALYRYVFSNLRFTPGNLMSWPSVAPTIAEERNVQVNLSRERSVVDLFLGEFSVQSGIPPHCTVFLFDSDRTELYESGHGTRASTDSVELSRYFTRRAEQAGYNVIDLKTKFASHYRLHHQRFDFWPIDRHWNWLGHKLAAEAAFISLTKSADCLLGQSLQRPNQ